VILASSVPVSASQNFIVESSLPDTRVLESGEKVQVLTQFLWAVIVVINFFSTMFHSLSVLSSEQESKSYPSQENARSQTGPV